MLLTEEQTMIRDMAKQFATDRLKPNTAKWEAEKAFPPEVIQELASLGLLGMTVSPDWDGAGTDQVSYALATMEIAAGDGAMSTMMSIQNSLVNGILEKIGTDEQKERFLKPLARGEHIGSFCLTEPQAGSDAAMLKTRATKEGNGYILNGTKQFISACKIGSTAIIFAVTDPDAGKKGMSAFVVPMDTPGFSIAKSEEKLGQKALDTSQINFDDMRVSGDCLLGNEGEGYKIALSNLEAGRVGIASQCVGMAEAALDYALIYAQERVTFGKPIIQHQAVGFRLAEMATKVETARQMVLHAAAMRDGGVPCLKEACMAKLYASEMAEEVCSDAIQTLGGYGYLNDYPVEKIYRDVRVCQIYEGTSDIQKLVISRQLMT
jgi:alkylation response protein AidB-like acyl-CoA dehydrogenase